MPYGNTMHCILLYFHGHTFSEKSVFGLFCELLFFARSILRERFLICNVVILQINAEIKNKRKKGVYSIIIMLHDTGLSLKEMFSLSSRK